MAGARSPSAVMERLTRLVLRHRWPLLGAWAVIFAASAVASSGLSDLLTNRFTLPGTDTHRAEVILEDHFGQRSTGSFTIVAASDGDAVALVPEVRRAAARADALLPTGRLVSVSAATEDVVVAQIVSRLEPADSKGYTDDMRRAIGAIPGATTYVTGQAAIEHDLEPVFAGDLLKGELIAVPIALLILVFTFGTLAFLIPFAFAIVTIPTALALVWIAAHFLELSTYLQNMVTLIGLGIAIDYSLLVVHRFREELRAGGDRDEAIVRTMATAGRAVLFSGTAVGIGLALLLFMPLPFMRGFGLGGLIIPTVSVAAAVTFLPVVLSLAGARLDGVRLLPRRWLERRSDHERGFWPWLARGIMRRARIVAPITAGFLLLLAAPVLALEVGPGSNEGIPRDLEAVQGYDVLAAAVGAGATAPAQVVVDTGRDGGTAHPAVARAVEELLRRLRADPEVAAVRLDDSAQHVDPTLRYLAVEVVGRDDYGKPSSLDFVERLRTQIVPAAGFPDDIAVYAGGGPPGGKDFLDLIYSAFPWLVLGVLAATFVLLVRAFRSLVLPLKAIVLNLLSIGAAYGLMVVVFKWGAGEPFGLIAYDQIEGWIPVMLFAVLFGLSMDYEVFLVSRMREAWDEGATNEEAVVLGLTRTGRLVTAAGLIMFAAFMGFVAGSVVGLQQLGLGLAAAILIDVTIVRALLVPSAMKLFGRWNWWLPEGVARLVRVQPSPLDHRSRRGEAAREPSLRRG
ncbi:MAG TPA: MMPL family transporter [Gaiellaceae bacterium]|nr:MMPL family transporter [Gaiellaceae bacterium]